jgi:hypothetical protein
LRLGWFFGLVCPLRGLIPQLDSLPDRSKRDGVQAMMSWEQQAYRWRTMPWSSSIRFFAAVFCLFASLNLVSASMSFRAQTVADLISSILIGGLFAMVWAFAGIRRVLWLFPLTFVFQFVAYGIRGRLTGSRHALNSSEMAHKLNLNGSLAITFIVLGYFLFLLFVRSEGERFFKTQTEIRLAGEIHRALVPVRYLTIGNVEIFGTSIPSSEVGGDLFDIVECEDG